MKSLRRAYEGIRAIFDKSWVNILRSAMKTKELLPVGA